MPDQVITLWRYRDLPEALFAQGKLEDAGVYSVLCDQNMVCLCWYVSNALGGLRLQVAAEDAQAAMEVLAVEIPPSFTAEEVGEEYVQPACPKCQSRDVGYETFRRGIALAFLWMVTLPVWIPRFKRWKCKDCFHRWKGDYE